MTVVPYRQPEEEPRSWVALMQPAVELAKAVATTDFVPNAYRGNPAAITAAILYGDEVGFGPMQSLAKIAVIDGKVTMYAEAQRALILAHGHELWIEEATTTRVTLAGRRRESDKTTLITWTLDDAKRAKLDQKPNWQRYPRQMLLARATAELARAVFADVIGGLAAIEELEDDTDAAALPMPETPPPATRRRRRAIAPAPPAPTPPAPAPPKPPPPPLPGEEPEPEPDQPAAATEPPMRPQEAPQPPPDNDPRIDQQDATAAMKRALDALVGQARNHNVYETKYVYGIVGAIRGVEPEPLAAEVKGIDSAGIWHWGPLRDTLNRTEARQLREHLSRVWARAQDAQARAEHEAATDPGPPASPFQPPPGAQTQLGEDDPWPPGF